MFGEAIALDEEIVTNQKIVFKSVFGKASGWKKLCPVKRNGVLLGVPPYSEEELRKISPDLHITAETTYKVEEDGELDLSTKLGKATWEWLKYNTEDIAPDLESSQTIKGCLFYIHSEDVEVKKEYNKAKEEKEVLNLIFDASHTKLQEVARLLGNRMDGQSPNSIATYLYSLTKSDGGRKRVKDAFSDGRAKVKLFLFRGLDTGVIRKGVDDTYKFGNVFLGMGEEGALNFLQDHNNSNYVAMMRSAMQPKSGTGVDPSIFDLTPAEMAVAAHQVVIPEAAKISNPNEFGDGPLTDVNSGNGVAPENKPETEKQGTKMQELGDDDMGADTPPPFTGKKGK